MASDSPISGEFPLSDSDSDRSECSSEAEAPPTQSGEKEGMEEEEEERKEKGGEERRERREREDGQEEANKEGE